MTDVPVALVDVNGRNSFHVSKNPPRRAVHLPLWELSVGMIPNLAASMAESPELLKGFLTIRQIFYSGTFSPGEIPVLALTNAFENGCRYCMAAVSILPNFAHHITQCPLDGAFSAHEWEALTA